MASSIWLADDAGTWLGLTAPRSRWERRGRLCPSPLRAEYSIQERSLVDLIRVDDKDFTVLGSLAGSHVPVWGVRTLLGTGGGEK